MGDGEATKVEADAGAIVVIDPAEDVNVCAVTLTEVPPASLPVRTDTGTSATTGVATRAADTTGALNAAVSVVGTTRMSSPLADPLRADVVDTAVTLSLASEVAEAGSVLEGELEAGVPDATESAFFSCSGARNWGLGTGPA